MGAFAQFLAKHETMQAMIWSSAQPGNVANMVDVAFGEDKESLKRVWARDTLGLSQADFSRKVQTVKNFDRLWEGLPAPPDGEEQFSAVDTILLDDSALKAHMQPFNHLILHEYDAETRRADVDAVTSHTEESTDPPIVDQTLLAVIGVLDEMSWQTNVAAWVRSGAMWAGYEPSGSAPDVEPETAAAIETLSVEEPVVLGGDTSRHDTLGPEVNVEAITELDKNGNPLSRSAKRKRPKKKKNNVTDLTTTAAQQSKAEWYEHNDVLKHWVDRGITTLKSMNIEIDHGIRTGTETPVPVSSPSSGSEKDHPPKKQRNDSKSPIIRSEQSVSTIV
ncbi:hypothetical protein DL93DRAFT_2082527, partial [Clavulina sp. PMI_390]